MANSSDANSSGLERLASQALVANEAAFQVFSQVLGRILSKGFKYALKHHLAFEFKIDLATQRHLTQRDFGTYRCIISLYRPSEKPWIQDEIVAGVTIQDNFSLGYIGAGPRDYFTDRRNPHAEGLMNIVESEIPRYS